MKRLQSLFIILLITFLLVGCTTQNKVNSTSTTETQNTKENSVITIEPLELSEHEKALVAKTGIQAIEYFSLNGTLRESEDIIFEILKIENGKEEIILRSYDRHENKFKNEVISFGMMKKHDEGKVTFIAGILGGTAASHDTVKTNASTSGKLLTDKVTLVKDKPVYLAGWQGTNENGLAGLYVKEDGTLSDYLLKAEQAFLYRVILTDKKG